MRTTLARQTAWTPSQPPPALPPTRDQEAEVGGTAAEPTEEEVLAALLADAECEMGCDWPEGPLSPSGCRW